MSEPDGWNYHASPDEGDARKFVTLEKDGMSWTGIRAWHSDRRIWFNNGEPELARVIAWRDLPEIAHGRFYRGKLIGVVAPVLPRVGGANLPPAPAPLLEGLMWVEQQMHALEARDTSADEDWHDLWDRLHAEIARRGGA